MLHWFESGNMNWTDSTPRHTINVRFFFSPLFVCTDIAKCTFLEKNGAKQNGRDALLTAFCNLIYFKHTWNKQIEKKRDQKNYTYLKVDRFFKLNNN